MRLPDFNDCYYTLVHFCLYDVKPLYNDKKAAMKPYYGRVEEWWRTRILKRPPRSAPEEFEPGDEDCTPDADGELEITEYHLQRQSPLFGKIPPEIRNMIFALATAQCYDYDRWYHPSAFYYRPGHRYASKSHTALLRTCRRAYAETRDLPLLQARFVLWYARPQREPNPGYSWQKLCQMSPRRLGLIPELHIYAQMFWLEQGDLQGLRRIANLAPRRLVLTIRHTDWWYWEHNNPLAMQNHWFRDAGLPESVEEVELQLETVRARREEELDAIIGQLISYGAAFSRHRQTDRFLEFTGEVREWSWTKTAYYGYFPHAAPSSKEVKKAGLNRYHENTEEIELVVKCIRFAVP